MVAIACPNADDPVTLARPVLWLLVPVYRPTPARVLRRRRQVAGVLFAVFVLFVVGVATVLTESATASWPERSSPPTLRPEAAVGAPASQRSQMVYIVEPGDTAWSIAQASQPNGDIRPLVDRLVAQEHGRPLQIGDRLILR